MLQIFPSLIACFFLFQLSVMLWCYFLLLLSPEVNWRCPASFTAGITMSFETCCKCTIWFPSFVSLEEAKFESLPVAQRKAAAYGQTSGTGFPLWVWVAGLSWGLAGQKILLLALGEWAGFVHLSVFHREPWGVSRRQEFGQRSWEWRRRESNHVKRCAQGLNSAWRKQSSWTDILTSLWLMLRSEAETYTRFLCIW